MCQLRPFARRDGEQERPGDLGCNGALLRIPEDALYSWDDVMDAMPCIIHCAEVDLLE